MSKLQEYVNSSKKTYDGQTSFVEKMKAVAPEKTSSTALPERPLLRDKRDLEGVQLESREARIAREIKETGALFKKECRQVIVRAMHLGMNSNDSPVEQYNSEHFINAMRAISWLSDTKTNLSNSRERELRDLTATMMQEFPTGADSAEFMDAVEKNVRMSLYARQFTTRNNPEQDLLDNAKEVFEAIDHVIRDARELEGTEELVDALTQRKVALDSLLIQSKAPGAFAISASAPAFAHLQQLETLISDEDFEGKSEYRRLVRDTKTFVEQLVQERPKPGTLYFEQAQEINNRLSAIIQEGQTSLTSAESKEVLSALGEVQAAIGNELTLAQEPMKLQERNIERVREFLTSFTELSPEANGEDRRLAETIETLDTLMRGITFSGPGDARDEESVKSYLQNRVKNVLAKIDHNEVKVSAENFNEQVEAELEYVRMVSGLGMLLGGPPSEGENLNASRMVSAYKMMNNLLGDAEVDPPFEMTRLMDPGSTYSLRQAINDTMLSESSPTEEEIANGRLAIKPIASFSDEELLELGFEIEPSADGINYDYSVEVQDWFGKPPVGQIAQDQLTAAYNVLYRLERIDQGVEASFQEIFQDLKRPLEVDSDSSASDIQRAKEELNTRCRTVIDEACKEVAAIEQEILGAASDTVERALEFGVDDMPALSEQGKEAFALLLEQQRRLEQPAIDRYTAQSAAPASERFTAIPMSMLMTGGQSQDEQFQGLSDAELSQRALQLGKEFSAAKRMYERLSTELRAPSESGVQTGYEMLVNTLDSFPTAARQTADVDYWDTMKLDPSLDAYFRSSEFERKVASDLRSMQHELGTITAQEMGGTIDGLAQRFEEYFMNNMEHPSRDLILQRIGRFTDKYSALYGRQANPLEEVTLPSTASE